MIFVYLHIYVCYAKSPQLCPTLCNPIDGSPPGSPVPGILQARTLEWVAISFSNAWKWKVKVKSLSCVRPSAPHGLQPSRLLRPWDFPGKSTEVGCHCLLPHTCIVSPIISITTISIIGMVHLLPRRHLHWHYNYPEMHGFPKGSLLVQHINGFGQMYNDMYLSLQYQAEYFNSPEHTLCSAYSSLPDHHP